MREVTLVNDAVKIRINGVVYKIIANDAEIVVMAENMKKECAKILGSNPDAKAIVRAVKHITESIDKVLGDGATAKISGGSPVTLKKAVEWFRVITSEAISAFADKLEDEQG